MLVEIKILISVLQKEIFIWDFNNSKPDDVDTFYKIYDGPSAENGI